MTIEEIIAKLPEEYQAIAQRYATIILDMGFDELQAWVEMLVNGNWKQAYQDLVAKMSTDELVNEQEKANEILKALNKENADSLAVQKGIIQQIFLTFLLMLRKQVE